jgi:hypothetical protein
MKKFVCASSRNARGFRKTRGYLSAYVIKHQGIRGMQFAISSWDGFGKPEIRVFLGVLQGECLADRFFGRICEARIPGIRGAFF